jgi:plasmid maintenance system antidote protein VapI
MARKNTLSQTLRNAAKADPRNATEIAAAAGIALPSLTRFLNEQRGLNLDSAERLAEVLGLELRKKSGKSGITN